MIINSIQVHANLAKKVQTEFSLSDLGVKKQHWDFDPFEILKPSGEVSSF